MKHLKIFLVVCAVIFMATSCKTKYYNFEKVTTVDIALVTESHPDAIFYESRVVLNGAPDSLGTDGVGIVEMCNVFQSNDTVILMHHEAGKVGKKVNIEVIPENFVMEDSPITYPVELTFKNAVERLSESNCVHPESNKVTLRRPFGPNPNNNPQYIFGSDGVFAFVNANTGDVINDYNYERVSGESELVSDWITNLDHDIYVGGVSCIEDDQHTGFDTWVGPTGWPWTNKVMWETALYEDSNFYYGRFIFHEYMLWWSYDYPYVVCKIPKCYIDGDLRTNEKLRNEVMWKLTDKTLKSYDYTPYIKNRVVRKINGHTVSFGKYACKYKEYFVISDSDYDW